MKSKKSLRALLEGSPYMQGKANPNMVDTVVGATAVFTKEALEELTDLVKEVVERECPRTWKEAWEAPQFDNLYVVDGDQWGITKAIVREEKETKDELTPEEKANALEHAQLAKQARKKGNKTALKMWEEEHWKDEKGRWHTEKPEDWSGETGIQERVDAEYSSQSERCIEKEAQRWEQEHRAEAFEYETMTPEKMAEVENEYPNAKKGMEHWLSLHADTAVQKIFWSEYIAVKNGGSAF